MFDLLEKELECDFAYIESEIANAEYESFDPDFFLEAGENSPESFLDRIIKKIQDIVERVKKAFSEIFAKKTVAKATEKFDEAKAENPAIANEKVKMKDYKQLQKLNDDTMTILLKTEDTEKIKKQMAKYRKQRNRILAMGTVTTVGLGALVYFMHKGYKDKMDKLEKKIRRVEKDANDAKNDLKKAKGKISDLKKEDESLANENSILKQKSPAARTIKRVQIKKAQTGEAVSSVKGVFTGVKESLAARTEVLQNETTDAVNMAKDVVTAVSEAKSPVSAMKAVGKTVSSVKNIGGAIKKGVAKGLDENLETYKERIEKTNSEIQRAKRVMAKSEKGSEAYVKAETWLKKAEPHLHKLKTTYATLLKQAGK